MPGYIGRELNPGHFTIDRFAGDASTVSFPLTYQPGSTTAITVIIDNVMQEPDEAYSVSGYNIIFTEAPDAPIIGVTNNIYVIHNGLTLTLPVPANGSVGQAQLSENVKNFYPQAFTGNNVLTDFSLTYPVQKSSSILVRENGVVQEPGIDYDVLVDELTLRFTTAPADGVEIHITYLGLRGTEDVIAGQIVEYPFTATEGQTIFSGEDNNALTLAYNVGYENVFLNGSKLTRTTDYTAVDGTSVTLIEGATASDILEIVSYGTWLPVDSYTKAESNNNFAKVPARNAILTKDAMNQEVVSTPGMSSKIYTGNGTSQSISTGLDMNTGDFGGLVWIKDRSVARTNEFVDSVRGVTEVLHSDTTAAESTDANGLTSFDSTGFSVGSSLGFNANTDNFVAWSFQTTKKVTGTTNRNKAYTAHYNTELGFSIVGYEGDGVDGHEIPHHLGVVPELTLFKNRDAANDWYAQSSLFGVGDYLILNGTSALANAPTVHTIFTNGSLAVDTDADYNSSGVNHIAYNFASKSGVCKIGKYIGIGAAGNYVSTEVDGGDAFKPAFVMIKNLTNTASWIIKDTIRGNRFLYPNLSNAEASSTGIEVDDNGLFLSNASGEYNTLNEEYIFMAFAESSIDSTKAVTDYDYATTPDVLSIANETLISVANGFNANGQVDTQYQFGAGITETYGAGHEDKHYYLYTSKLGVLGVNEVRPLIGLTRNDADKYGVVSPSDKTLRTTSKHFDYESDSGVALASEDLGAAYRAFNKFDDPYTGSSWVGTVTGASWLQYKHTEPRILKSWRFRGSDATARDPKRFTIEGSNDGYAWAAIDSTYTSSDYIGNGDNLWGDLQSTAGNTTAYNYHRINITANNGDGTYTEIAELELNTIIASDYYLVEEGKMYNSSDVVQERMYLGEFKTDSDGDIINSTIINYPVAGQEFGDVNVHGDLTVYGEANGRQFATAWVNFDGTQNPPLIKDSFNVKDIVDLGTGRYQIHFENPMTDLGYYAAISGVEADAMIGQIGTEGNNYNYMTIAYRDYLAAYRDTPRAGVLIFGGKKIK